jgi:hypothetical protein
MKTGELVSGIPIRRHSKMSVFLPLAFVELEKLVSYPHLTGLPRK